MTNALLLNIESVETMETLGVADSTASIGHHSHAYALSGRSRGGHRASDVGRHGADCVDQFAGGRRSRATDARRQSDIALVSRMGTSRTASKPDSHW